MRGADSPRVTKRHFDTVVQSDVTFERCLICRGTAVMDALSIGLPTLMTVFFAFARFSPRLPALGLEDGSTFAASNMT